MSIHRRYFPGSSVSRYLPTGETGYESAIFQSTKKVLDAELNLVQDLGRQTTVDAPSGFILGDGREDPLRDFIFTPPFLPGPVPNPDFVADSFRMRKQTVLVAGHRVVVEYTLTDTTGENLITLPTSQLFDGTPLSMKRTDFVFLEVWLAPLQDSANATGNFLIADPVVLAPGDTITIGGVVLTGVLGPAGPLQFEIDPGSADNTAANIVTSIGINVPAVTAISSGPLVLLRAAVSGTAGNLIALASSNPGGATPSGPTLTGGVDAPGKPGADLIYRHGNVQSSAAVALPDDLADPSLGVETSRRVQVQYRIRIQSGANFKTQCDGFSALVLAQGSTPAPVAGYPFIPADGQTVLLNSDARDQVAGYAIGYGVIDNGLYIAGDGTLAAANALGTVDGYVYALPIGFVFRRNNAELLPGQGFDPVNNTNGALPSSHAIFANPFVYAPVQPGESDRPDGLFCDEVAWTDFLDLRPHVIPEGRVAWDRESENQVQSLLDGTFRTWAIDTASKQVLGSGSGDVSTQPLVCDEIGRTPAKGGNPPLSGNTGRGVPIRNFDHVARRFGSQPVVERIVLALLPGDTIAINPGKYVVRQAYAVGFAGWAEGDEIHLDFLALNATTLGDFDPAWASIPGPGPVGSVWDFVPPGTTITDILSVYHDDGNYAVPVDQRVQLGAVAGLGTSHVTLTLDTNTTQVTGGLPLAPHDVVGTLGTGDVGSPRRIFVEVEISYPLGAGLTMTPNLFLDPNDGPWPFGPMLENDVPAGGSQRPPDMETPLGPGFREGFRETKVEYVANDPTGGGGNTGIPIGTLTPETIVSRNNLEVVFLRRIFGSPSSSVGVTDLAIAAARQIDVGLTEFGSSSRKAVLLNTGIAPALPLSGAGQTLVGVTYFAQDPLPNYGPPGLGYQQSIYYRSHAPQTCGVKEGTISTGPSSFPYIGIPGPLPNLIEVEPLYVGTTIYSSQAGKGNVDLGLPYLNPLDQIAVNDGRAEIPPPVTLFPGEWALASGATISITSFSGQVGSLRLQLLVPPDASATPWILGGLGATDLPFQDAEFRATYPFINRQGARPFPVAEPLGGPAGHKVFLPILGRPLQDSVLFRKAELLLIIMSRIAEGTEENVIKFLDSGTKSGAAVYRSRRRIITR
jgi:hypothetical protein